MANPWRTLLSLLTWTLGLGLVQAEPKRPPNYHFDHMPDTSFSCAGKVVGGYYADIDTDCQMFHVCVQVDENDVRDFKFMCPNDTVFDQENFICANWFEIDCAASAQFFGKNLHLFQTLSEDLTRGGALKAGSKIPGATLSFPEELSTAQRKQVELQQQQLQDLEKQQNETNSKQQKVLDLHQRRQEEHQRKQLEILQHQQLQLEQLRPLETLSQGRKVPSASSQTVSMSTSSSSISISGTHPSSPNAVSKTVNDKLPVPAAGTTANTEGKKDATLSGQKDAQDGTIEYDYYYYDYDDSTEAQGTFYLNDEYDPNAAVVHASRGQLPVAVGMAPRMVNSPVHPTSAPPKVANIPIHATSSPPKASSTNKSPSA